MRMAPARGYKLPTAFKIDFDGIDTEHDEMVSILNVFARQVENGLGESFESAFILLLDSMKKHFAHEETYMFNFKYPGANWHREHHQKCLEVCDNLFEDCRQSGQANLETIQGIFDQIITDVARADLKFREYLVSIGKLAK